MKTLRLFILTFFAFILVSCNQLNLKNPAGVVSVSLPGASTRSVLSEEENSEEFNNLNYKISLWTVAGKFVDEKTAVQGGMVEFPEVLEGSYVVKAFCYGSRNGVESCIAAGFESAEVKGGEITPVKVPLYYNRLDKVDVAKSRIIYTGKTEFSSLDELKEGIRNAFYAEIVFTNGWTETDADVICGDPVKTTTQQLMEPGTGQTGTGRVDTGATGQIVSGDDSGKYKVIVTWSRNEALTEIFYFYVVKKQESQIVGDLTVGLSEANPCITSLNLLSAITQSKDGDTIYLKGVQEGSGYVFSMTETHAITKNLTIKSVVDNLTIKRNSGAYIYISSGCQLSINKSNSDKKIKFTDDGSGNTSNFIMGEVGKLVAYNAEFEGIGWGAVLVKEAKLHGCSFKEIASKYGAVHVGESCTALIDSCTFASNTSTNAAGYGDIYLVKNSSSLALTGSVSTDISIYVANSSYDDDPEIDVNGITFADGKKLRVKVGVYPTTPSPSIYLFTQAPFQMYPYMTFAVEGDDEEYEVNDYEEMTEPYYTMMDGEGKVSVHCTSY